MRAMSGSQYQQNQGNDALMSVAFLGLLVAGVSFFAWYKFHTQITIGVFAVLQEELRFASLWSGSYRGMSAALAANDPSMIKIGQLLNAVGVVSHIYRFPAAILMVALGAVCVVRASGERYTEKLDLDRLMKVQAQVFPFISAYLNRPLSLVAPDLLQPRPADPALHLGEWISIHALCRQGTYDFVKARRSLIAQLGPVWTGVRDAPPAAKAMFAVFALHAARERDQAAALLGTLSKSLIDNDRAPTSSASGAEGPAGPLVFSEPAMRAVDAVLASGETIAPSAAIAGQHGFTTTALMGLLMHARKRAGVLAPGQFAFLKMVDRPLWYALHSLGFPLTAEEDGPMLNSRIEALGARAHWEAERCAGGALTTPKIETAEAAIRDRIAHSLNSKRKLLEVR
jgi:intracellular multiplication protein IcmP